MDFPKLTLAFACAVAGYLSWRAFTPPNPNPQSPYVHDRMGKLFGTPMLVIRKVLTAYILAHHLVLILALPDTAQLMCPNSENLNYATLFSWSPYIITCLIAVSLIGAPLRLAAFGRLGKNFTFRLQTPSTLVTTGMYKYLQHPSYTGQALVIGGNLAAFWRWDGALGCWISPGMRAALSGWGKVVVVIFSVLAALGLWRRVLDEERMLKDKFGDDWVRWNRSTKRFVPALF